MKVIHADVNVSDSESPDELVGWSSLVIGDEGSFTFDPHGDMFVVGTITSAGVFSAAGALEIADANPGSAAAG